MFLVASGVFRVTDNQITKSSKKRQMRKINFIIFFLSSLSVFAQQAKDSVKTEVVEVTRSFEPKVQDAYKLDINPVISATPEKKIPVKYQIMSVPVASTFQPEKGGMANFNPGNLVQKNFGSYVSIAGGNYVQIKSDAFISYPLNDQMETAFVFSHYSSQGKTKDSLSPFYHTVIDGLFNYNTDGSIWNFDLGYDGHINKLHEIMTIMNVMDPGIKSYQNNYNNLHLDINGKFKELFIKNLAVKYNNLWDFSDNSEHLAQLGTKLLFPIGDIGLKTSIQSDIVSGHAGKNKHLDSPTDLKLSYTNFDIGLLPAITIENDKLVANLGAKIFYQNDSIYKNLQFIPDINVRLNLIYEKLSAFGGITGDLHQNSQTEFYQKNPYLTLQQNIIPTLIPYNIFGGFDGAFSSSFAYEIRLGVKRIKNYGFYNFVPSSVLQSGFDIYYDDMTQSYFKTKINVGVSKYLDLKFNLTYMQNNPDHLSKALFIPDFDIKSMLIFRPTDKLSINTTFHRVSQRKYADNIDDVLKAYNDLNIGIRYNINKEITGFVNAYNLFNQDYQIYYNYPVQKLQFMAGVTYRFDIPKN